ADGASLDCRGAWGGADGTQVALRPLAGAGCGVVRMILTVTLNAAIDRTLAVPNFRLGRRHRAVEQTAIAGGKGVNVARALRPIGRPVLATGTAGARLG